MSYATKYNIIILCLFYLNIY